MSEELKVSEKAKELIGDFSTATEQTALSPTVAAFNLYCATREDLEDYIAELETLIDQLIEAGNAVVNAYPTWVREEDKWDDLVKDWKEREE